MLRSTVYREEFSAFLGDAIELFKRHKLCLKTSARTDVAPYSFSLSLFREQIVAAAAFRSFLKAKAPLPLERMDITACILVRST